ncbi:7-cyano-7-deazaguanine synthase [Bacillus thermotolerans]|uniref:7-cyano-7-deazaguanine synthase n=1 Tax=Bacillus thermotolerans TaxID=1221996 RepID=UPI000591CAC9|nr:7-cyano-7-deazaguanine synthase [Bacillus thermotolerans]KKB45031.1 hypothetical protein QY96_00155 [Bacillus thermotolerans]
MIHNVLWTGGWDSTFRVLDLILNKNKTVRPYYILDRDRKSTSMELKTMERIKAMIKEKNPEAEQRILETVIIEKDNIPINNEITKNYSYLASLSRLGSQYDWLARYADSQGINNIELCIHKDDKAEGFIKNDVVIVTSEEDSYFRLKTELSKPQLCIFSYFHFPLLEMTKLEMGKISKESDFDHIMEGTWFCFNPTKIGTPCGYCNPCKYTREEGLGRRVPKVGVLDKGKILMMNIQRKIKVMLRK